jgi:hypothetical protein
VSSQHHPNLDLAQARQDYWKLHHPPARSHWPHFRLDFPLFDLVPAFVHVTLHLESTSPRPHCTQQFTDRCLFIVSLASFPSHALPLADHLHTKSTLTPLRDRILGLCLAFTKHLFSLRQPGFLTRTGETILAAVPSPTTDPVRYSTPV